jgi:hypothetical protein
MPEYILKARVTLEGATMFVTADSKEEALKKAQGADWDDIDYKGAALVDWVPDEDSIKENK